MVREIAVTVVYNNQLYGKLCLDRYSEHNYIIIIKVYPFTGGEWFILLRMSTKASLLLSRVGNCAPDHLRQKGQKNRDQVLL